MVLTRRSAAAIVPAGVCTRAKRGRDSSPAHIELPPVKRARVGPPSPPPLALPAGLRLLPSPVAYVMSTSLDHAVNVDAPALRLSTPAVRAARAALKPLPPGEMLPLLPDLARSLPPLLLSRLYPALVQAYPHSAQHWLPALNQVVPFARVSSAARRMSILVLLRAANQSALSILFAAAARPTS